MEGRWASLALRAQCDKALDYARVGRDDQQSLLLELLVLKEGARRTNAAMAARYYDLYRTRSSKEALKEAVDWLGELERLERVWSREEKAGSDNRTREEKLMDYYNQVMADNAGTSVGQKTD